VKAAEILMMNHVNHVNHLRAYMGDGLLQDFTKQVVLVVQVVPHRLNPTGILPHSQNHPPNYLAQAHHLNPQHLARP
jgi:hypothetical protein